MIIDFKNCPVGTSPTVFVASQLHDALSNYERLKHENVVLENLPRIGCAEQVIESTVSMLKTFGLKFDERLQFQRGDSVILANREAND